jgi:hypothetical protein
MRRVKPGLFCACSIFVLLIGCSGNKPTPPPPTLTITTSPQLSQATINTAYTASLTATGGTAPYTWKVSSGALPSGLSLSAAGVISGTPTVSGSSSFTAQVVDGGSPSQNATISLQLQISGGPLRITTTALPGGQEGMPYSFQLSATGGVPPYVWSIDPNSPLPGGLTLSSSGLISGTPKGPSNSTPRFTVTASVNPEAAELNLFINPVAGIVPDGTYAFVFSGVQQPGIIQSPNLGTAISGIFSVSGGVVQSGLFDENTNLYLYPPQIQQPILGGTMTINTDGIGSLVLNTSTGNMSFAFAKPASATQGTSSAIALIGFGSDVVGSGVMKFAQPIASTTAISGNYAFLLSGTDLGATSTGGRNGRHQALLCSIHTDGAGNINAGYCDTSQNGISGSFPTVSGTYSVDTQGRGVLRLTLASPSTSQATYNYSFYQVSPSELALISIDQVASAVPLLAGTAFQQSSGPFTSASLPTTSIIRMNGLTPVGVLQSSPDLTLGIGKSDGKNNLSFTYDEYNGALTSSQNLALTYSVDPNTGRVATMASSGAGPTLYLIDNKRAFVLGADKSSSSGVLESQAGAPFSNTSFSGSYLGGSLPQGIPGTLNEAGLVQPDGSGNVFLTTDRTTQPSSQQEYSYVTGTYSVDSSGRVVVTQPDNITRIFYIVSPNKVAYITEDNNGYLGVFEQ